MGDATVTVSVNLPPAATAAAAAALQSADRYEAKSDERATSAPEETVS